MKKKKYILFCAMPPREKFTPLIIHILQEEGSQISDLKSYLKKKTKKRKPNETKVNWRKETIKIRVEINEIEEKNDRK